MAKNLKEQSLPANSVTSDEQNRQADKPSDIADAITFAAILKSACQTNRGHWKTLIASAIIGREMDSRSVAAWKLCAKAGFVGGDVEAALDCLLEALSIDLNDGETITILDIVIENHLRRTLEVC